MSDWLLKANEADVGYGGRQAGDPEDEVDDERMVELHGVAGKAEVVVYDYHVPQIDAVAEPSQREPGSPGEEDIDWTSEALLTGEDDPRHTHSPGQPVEAVVEGAGSLGDVEVREVGVDVHLVTDQAEHHGQAGHGGTHPEPGRRHGSQLELGLVLVLQIVEHEAEDQSDDVGLEPCPGHQVEVLHVPAGKTRGGWRFAIYLMKTFLRIKKKKL